MVRSRERYRDRQRITLPKFEPRFIFDLAWARYDKIEINFDIGKFNTLNTQDIHDVFVAVGRDSEFFRNNGSEGLPQLNIRKRGRGWLVGGRIRVRPRPAHRDSNIRASLSINPTRFFAHNPSDRIAERRSGETPNSWGDPRLFKIERNIPLEIELTRHSLGFSDNYIPNSRLAAALRLDWNGLIYEYLEIIQSKIVAEIERASPDRLFISNDTITGWTLSRTEIYWEFEHENAVAVADDFGKFIANSFKSSSTRYHLDEAADIESGRSYIFKTTNKNISIALYAKTDNRIRIECRFLKNPKECFADINNTLFPNTDLMALVGMLESLKEKALETLSPIAEKSRYYDSTQVPNTTALAIQLSTVSSITKNPLFIKHILEGALIDGRISETTDDTFNTVLLELSEAGLLKKLRKKANKPRFYEVVGSLAILRNHIL